MNDGDTTRFFHLSQTDGPARRGEVSTSHGVFQTPAFMPVGTSGAVKGLTAEHLEQCGPGVSRAELVGHLRWWRERRDRIDPTGTGG